MFNHRKNAMRKSDMFYIKRSSATMRRHVKRRETFILVFSSFLGLCLGLWLSKNVRVVRHVLRCHQIVYSMSESHYRRQTLRQELKYISRFLLVAIFTKTLPGSNNLYNDLNIEDTGIKFVYFTAAIDNNLRGSSMVHLEDVSSEKAVYSSMLRYVSGKYATNFNWFIFTSCSFFVNVKKLSFLRSLDHSKRYLFLPEASVHKGFHNDTRGLNRTDKSSFYRETEEYERTANSVLIFQPGITMSRSMLEKLSTNYCLNKTKAYQTCLEDVTISGLIEEDNDGKKRKKNFATCRKEYEDLTRTDLVTTDLSKNMDCLHRVRVQLLSEKVRVLSFKQKKLETKLNILQSFISQTVYEKRDEIRSYKGFKQRVDHAHLFTLTKNLEINNKDSWSLHYRNLQGIAGIIRTVMDAISNAHHENLQFHALHYGYMLNQPTRGLQYLLNIFTNKQRHIAKTIQEFGAIKKRIVRTSETKPVTIVVPLAGRLENFKQFMKNVEQNILKKQEPITLLVAYFPEVKPSLEHKKIFHQFNMTYRNHIFIWLDLPGSFARARALQAAVDFKKDNNLLFFADVDLTFNKDFLQRCRDNTVAKQRVYFPVMFKLFNPKLLGFKLNSTDYFRSLGREVGDWALFSFGPVCAYRDDVISIGGFNVRIKEWGYEDVHLFEAFISGKKYEVIRAADPGLVHIYHAHSKCDVIKNNIQRLMCVGAMLNSLASEDSIAKYLLIKKYIKL